MAASTVQRAEPGARKRAVLYLRVSTVGQVNTDYDPEGISLPAQRTACQRRAIELDADVVAEYVEPGRSATTVDGRKEFQKMMARVKAERDVDYVIVYARSRMFRNSVDAAITKRDLRKAGAFIVSVMDYTEDTAIGDLVATVLDGVNEYQSKASGADISYKMGQKVARGGSIGRAPLGYLNVREMYEGREVRTIAVDPQRAPLVVMAFELYATGTYSFRLLLETLTDAGLRSRPSKHHPNGNPISTHKLGQLLRDRFYLGFVRIKDQEHPGRHEPIIPGELFDRVQEVLDAERGGGTRARIHSHYLKGSLWCARCSSRLIYVPGKSKSGDVYFYFLCRGRQQHTCDLPYLKAADVERAVTDNYASITLPADLRARITGAMQSAATTNDATGSLMREQLTRQLAKLDAKTNALLDLVGDPNWPNDKITERMRAVRDEQAKLQRRLESLITPNLDSGVSALRGLLDLLADPQQLYVLAGDRGRKVLNQAFFTRLYLDRSDDAPFVARDDVADPVRPLVDARRDWRGLAGECESGGNVLPDNTAAVVTPTLLLRTALTDGCSSKSAMVEPRGFEPLTFCLPDRCSTS